MADQLAAMNAMTPQADQRRAHDGDGGDNTVAGRAVAGRRSVGVVTAKYGGSLFLRNQAGDLPLDNFRRQTTDEIAVGR